VSVGFRHCALQIRPLCASAAAAEEGVSSLRIAWDYEAGDAMSRQT
jgi:hypothetical protein